MGDVIGFKGKKQAKVSEDQEEIALMACGLCESPGFYLSTDGRVFCQICEYPVAVSWTETDENSAA